MVAEGGAQSCVKAGVEGEARCVRWRRMTAAARGGRTVKGKGDDGRRQRGWTTVPLPQFARQEGDAAAGETDESASASPPPAPTQAWRCTMGIRGTAARASLTPRRADFP